MTINRVMTVKVWIIFYPGDILGAGGMLGMHLAVIFKEAGKTSGSCFFRLPCTCLQDTKSAGVKLS